MPPDPLLPGENDPPTPAPATRGSRVRCEFCECTLAPNGDVLSVSAKARALREASDAGDKATKTIETLTARVRELETQIKAAADARADRELSF